MCGIAGFVQRRDAAPADIHQMIERIHHRGPDGSGTWTGTSGDWTATLGHRRLSIIDIEGGHQPMGNEDGSVQITYNGEVFNFQSLRPPLESAGHRFASRCDTEVIIHHFEQHGVSGLAALDGMFAFALWDSRSRTLLLARDRVGIKPLYYALLPDGAIAFASELTALLAHPGVDRHFDPAGLSSFFFSDYSLPPNTLVRGARKLAPGHYLVWRDGCSDEPKPFWQPSLDSPPRSNSDVDSSKARLRDLLDESVNAQLVSDVPVGVFLSGGIDSSLVAALARRHMSRRPQTFSIGFDDPQFDESNYARIVANAIGSDHVEERFNESTLLSMLDDALNCLDEPMADPSILPTFLLSRIAAKHVKVVLGGDGGDELWAGYPTYKAHRYASVYQHVPRAIRSAMIDPLVRRMALRDGYQTLEWKAKRFALRWADEPAMRHLRWMSNTDLPDLPAALPGFSDLGENWNAATGHRNGSADTLNQILSLDFQTYLPGSVLTKVDRASMAHGLEVRPPMLSNALIALSFSLPSRFKLNGKTSKFLLKKVADELLPAEIVHRRKKGFAIPLARWLRGPLKSRIDRILSDSELWQTGLLNRETFELWASEHHARRIDRAKPLWALLVLDHWHRRVIAPSQAQSLVA